MATAGVLSCNQPVGFTHVEKQLQGPKLTVKDREVLGASWDLLCWQLIGFFAYNHDSDVHLPDVP
ncbi:hypothetical protein PAXRUDRAFT_21624 [Paxillus rubicundulus Ve08.2h10]|uniref:Uncharacterized protein n=1 Tax=Paxillus rubicundulus Ve08.2h10 TaxID=930991 RepID=A0A0D0CB35_9AGAM|nr:hypothetical protein PAXRUDRAFT_21624 [Paxillus rubicundulus Ve08.2h10]